MVGSNQTFDSDERSVSPAAAWNFVFFLQSFRLRRKDCRKRWFSSTLPPAVPFVKLTIRVSNGRRYPPEEWTTAYRSYAVVLPTMVFRLRKCGKRHLFKSTGQSRFSEVVTLQKEYLVHLREILAKRFSKGELQTLCFDLGIDYEELPGTSVTDKARELVSFAERHNSIPDLLAVGARQRPDISWPSEIEALVIPPGSHSTYDYTSEKPPHQPRERHQVRTINIGRGKYVETHNDNRRGTFIGRVQLALPLWYIFLPLILLSALISALIGVYQFTRSYDEFLPENMTGEFNIAIADFGQLNNQGNLLSSAEASEMAAGFSQVLNEELADKPEDDQSIEIRSSQDVQMIPWKTLAEYEQAVVELSTRLDADIVFYGYINVMNTEFVPKFYLSPDRLPYAEELSGHYELRSPIIDPIDVAGNNEVRREVSRLLDQHSFALQPFIQGLSRFRIGDYENAESYFKQAANAEIWIDDTSEAEQVKELLYLFMGNTAGRLAKLDEAEAYYLKALSVTDDEDARARLGLAEIVFQRSHGNCQPDNTQVHVEGLHEAINIYEDVLHVPVPSEFAAVYVTTKASFGLGRSYLCLSLAHAEDAWVKAESAFQQVIDIYENNNDETQRRIKERAAESHANLALVYWHGEGDATVEQGYRAAIEQYETAIELTEASRYNYKTRQALFYSMIGTLHIYLHEYDVGREAFDKAIELDEDNADYYNQQWGRLLKESGNLFDEEIAY